MPEVMQRIISTRPTRYGVLETYPLVSINVRIFLGRELISCRPDWAFLDCIDIRENEQK